MEKREIDPELKKKVQKDTVRIIIAITVVLVAYVAYTLVTKNVNMIIFEVLLGTFLVAYTVLSDVAEPYRLGMLKNMTIGQQSAYIKMLLADAVGVGALLYWIVGMNSETGNDILIPVLIYVCASQMKRKFKPEFEGTEDKEEKAAEEEAIEEVAEEEASEEGNE